MWPKLYNTIGFLLTLGTLMVLTTKKQKRFAKNIRATNIGIIDYLFAMGILLLGFVEFWFLTRLFPYTVIFALVIASLTGVLMYNAIAAVAGFSHQQEKIKVLSVIWTASHVPAACFLLIIGFFFFLIMAIGSLYMFWKLPSGSATARVWIAFFLFMVPQAGAILVMLLIGTPMITSEYVDDDVRSSFVAGQFSNIIYSTVTLVFPIWLFQQDIAQVFHHTPPMWLYGLVLSVPLLVFVLLGVFPFFVGMYRYRSKVRSLLKWRTDWLKGIQKVLTLPKEGPQTAQLFEEKLVILANEIERRTGQTELLKFYHTLQSTKPAVSAISSQVDNPTPPSDSLPLDDVQRAAASATQNDLVVPPQPNGADSFKEVRTIVEEHENELREWDVQFHDLHKLTEIYRSLVGVKPADAKEFIQMELNETKEEVEVTNTKRNTIAACLMSIMPLAGSWFFTNYFGKVLTYLEKVVSLQ
ncbi:MAG TPA: hypothetical protein VJ372_00305 [Pyrinomonadaceae bacterium]|jgi:hypothetical protein|nr:hypothetical protein [Pyrinomonadaceae bacterium]